MNLTRQLKWSNKLNTTYTVSKLQDFTRKATRELEDKVSVAKSRLEKLKNLSPGDKRTAAILGAGAGLVAGATYFNHHHKSMKKEAKILDLFKKKEVGNKYVNHLTKSKMFNEFLEDSGEYLTNQARVSAEQARDEVTNYATKSALNKLHRAIHPSLSDHILADTNAAGNAAKRLVSGKGGRGIALEDLMSTRTAQLGIGGGTLVGGYKVLNQEKQAALSDLLEMGIDFDNAVSLVKQAEQEVYGN